MSEYLLRPLIERFAGVLKEQAAVVEMFSVI
jgi:hypothetical protein